MSEESVIILNATRYTAANTVIHRPGTGGAPCSSVQKKKKNVMKACKSKCIAASDNTQDSDGLRAISHKKTATGKKIGQHVLFHTSQRARR